MKPPTLWRIFIAQWKLKLVAGGAITTAFWIGYFLLEHFPARPVTQMPKLAIDRSVPFVPGAAVIYLS